MHGTSFFHAFSESLAHAVYWFALLAILIGGIMFFGRRDARKRKSGDDDAP